MTFEIGKGRSVVGVNPFDETQPTAKPTEAPKVAGDTNPFRNGLFGGLSNMAKTASPGESSGLRFGAQLPALGSNNPFAKLARAAGSMVGEASPVTAAVATLGNAALGHMGPASKLGQFGSLAEQFGTDQTNSFLNNASNSLDLSQLQSSANQQMSVTNAAARIQAQVKFNDTIANMNVSAWDNIKQMFSK